MPSRNSGFQDARTVDSDSTARHCWRVLQPLRDHEHTIYAGRGVKPPGRRDGRVIVNYQGRKMAPGESPPGRGRDVGLDTRRVPWSRTRRSAYSASGHRDGLSRKQLRAGCDWTRRGGRTASQKLHWAVVASSTVGLMDGAFCASAHPFRGGGLYVFRERLLAGLGIVLAVTEMFSPAAQMFICRFRLAHERRLSPVLSDSARAGGWKRWAVAVVNVPLGASALAPGLLFLEATFVVGFAVSPGVAGNLMLPPLSVGVARSSSSVAVPTSPVPPRVRQPGAR